MDIAALRVRVTFQKNTLQRDQVGNHVNSWEDVFTCWATPVHASGQEVEEAAHTKEKEVLDFTVRYCSELSHVEATSHRILCKGWIYNIKAVDPMGFKMRSLKFHCEKEGRV